MVRTTIVIWLVLGVVGSSPPAGAQIVNVQGQLAKAPATDGATGQIEINLDWRDGNTSVLDVGGGGAVLVRSGRVLGLAIVRAEYGQSRDVAFARKTFEHARARVTLDCRWRWEAFVQHEYDEFRRLSIRGVAGTGPALQIVHTKPVAILAAAAYMLEFEQLDQRAGTRDAGVATLKHRASLYVTGIERLGDNASIVETIYLQPRFDDAGDVRVLGEFALTTRLTKWIALTDGLTLAYDRNPPDGIQRSDIQLKVGVLATF